MCILTFICLFLHLLEPAAASSSRIHTPRKTETANCDKDICQCFIILKSYTIFMFHDWMRLPEKYKRDWTYLDCNRVLLRYDNLIACEQRKTNSNCLICLKLQRLAGNSPDQQLWQEFGCEAYSKQLTGSPPCDQFGPNISALDVCTLGTWTNRTRDKSYLIVDEKSLSLTNYFAREIERSCNSTSKTMRVELLKKREWLPQDSRCQIYSPASIFTIFQDRKIFYLGDSVGQQIFASLVTSLYNFSLSQFSIKFADVPAWHHFNEFWHIDARFNWANLVLSFQRFERFDGVHVFREMLKQSTDADMIVLNLGLHYNEADKDEYRYHLTEIARELDSRARPAYFMQTTPQHFNGSSNGYWKPSTHFDVHCHRHSDASSAIHDDWRNNIAEEVFLYHPKIKIIRIREGLLSEWNVHVGMEHRLAAIEGHADCTHYCLIASGVFEYIFTMIFNTVAPN